MLIASADGGKGRRPSLYKGTTSNAPLGGSRGYRRQGTPLCDGASKGLETLNLTLILCQKTQEKHNKTQQNIGNTHRKQREIQGERMRERLYERIKGKSGRKLITFLSSPMPLKQGQTLTLTFPKYVYIFQQIV